MKLLNTQRLFDFRFSRRALLLFFVYWIAWIVLFLATDIPTLIKVKVFPWQYILVDYLLLGSINFLLFYLVCFYLVPRFAIKQKKWFLAIALCVAATMICIFLKWEIISTRNLRNVEKFYASEEKNYVAIHKKPAPATFFVANRQTFANYLFANYFYSFSIMVLALAIRLLLEWYLQEKVKKDLEHQKLKAELSFLKLQVNPHFLFNALNNIYSLAMIEKSIKTGESILKLSDLLRYVLYEKEDDENKVSLDKEIMHINSFIDLQKLRYMKDIYIHFSIEGETTGKKVPPLLLFPLIENACKHGILDDPEKPVSIEVKITGKEIFFSIHNFTNDYLKDATGGIGLENVRKRLALLYSNERSLKIKETEQEFFVELELPS